MIAEELSGNDDYVELAFNARKLDDKVKCLTLTLLEELIKLATQFNQIPPCSCFSLSAHIIKPVRDFKEVCKVKASPKLRST